MIFNVTEGEEKYNNKITIIGNDRTTDSVIRRELSFFEGDPFNSKEVLSCPKRILGFLKGILCFLKSH